MCNRRTANKCAARKIVAAVTCPYTVYSRFVLHGDAGPYVTSVNRNTKKPRGFNVTCCVGSVLFVEGSDRRNVPLYYLVKLF
jgi:hypothetical protein